MLEEIGKIEFIGKKKKDKDISAIASFGNFLAIGSDESKRKIQILQQKNSEQYEFRDNLTIKLPVLAGHDDQEIDIEGICINRNNSLFIVGSHSLKRSKIKDDETYANNRRSIKTVVTEDKKNSIFKLEINPNTGKEKDPNERQTIRIKEIIENDEILGIFTQIPSKENGVDIEGIAADKNIIYLGFRGPVLRGNYVPVMKIPDLNNISDYEILFVNLEGNGIRDICKVQHGFLIIAGPVGDGVGGYQLYFWNGLDCIPGKDKTKDQKSTISLLGQIPTPRNAKAEGITMIEETSSNYKFIIVYDGLLNGDATAFTVKKNT